MLRITKILHAESPTLRLEGKLLEPLLSELHDACRSTAENPAALTLDLAGLTYVDPACTTALHELKARGIKLSGCSPLIRELLKETRP